MCGLGCLLINDNTTCLCRGCADPFIKRGDVELAVANRGPDSINTVNALGNDIWFVGSVLHIQGSELTKQPYVDSEGNILLWNGEVFAGLTDFQIGESDTNQIASLMKRSIDVAIKNNGPIDLSNNANTLIISKAALAMIVRNISYVHGPYAFVYYSKSLQLLIYGRDPIGRRSLLRLRTRNTALAISSVWVSSIHDNDDCVGNQSVNLKESEDNACVHDSGHENVRCVEKSNEANWDEIPIMGLYAHIISNKKASPEFGGLDNAPLNCTCRRTTEIFSPWPSDRTTLSRLPKKDVTSRSNGTIDTVPQTVDNDNSSSSTSCLHPFQESSTLLYTALLTAVRSRVGSIFSQVDEIASLSNDSLRYSYSPSNAHRIIDIASTVFTSDHMISHSTKMSPAVSSKTSSNSSPLLHSPRIDNENQINLADLKLSDSLQNQSQTPAQNQQPTVIQESEKKHTELRILKDEKQRLCRIGVLFSGGIDSVVLAAMLHLSLDNPMEAIDLFNVAFYGAEVEVEVEVADEKLMKDIYTGIDKIDEISGITFDENAANGPERIENTNSKKSITYCKNTRKTDSTKIHSETEPPAPDRLAAILALKELKELYPQREWRLVHIDVSSNERKLYENRVKNLIRPRDTHMDLNIGTALWFASRGIGYLKEYSLDEMIAAGCTNDNTGRPLVRTGGEGAARSVGLPSWSQKEGKVAF